MNKITDVVDQLYRKNFGKMVATLLYVSRDIDLATAEDIVQDSFSGALIHWTKNGIPLNANGWSYTVCRNKALNKIKKINDFNLQTITKAATRQRRSSASR